MKEPKYTKTEFCKVCGNTIIGSHYHETEEAKK